MEMIFDFIESNYILMIFYSIVINIIVLLVFFIQRFKLSKIQRMYRSVTRDMKGKNLEELIHQYYEKIDSVDIRMNQIEREQEKIEQKLLKSIQHVGIVRYDAFDDIGGNLSFSLALLDEEQDGLVLTSIYSRNNSTVYGKPIRKGKSSYALSVEELQALDRAKENFLDEHIKTTSEKVYNSETS